MGRNLFPGSRMAWKDDRHPFHRPPDGREDVVESLGVIHVAGTMEREDRIGDGRSLIARLEVQPLQNLGSLCGRSVREQRVDHHVPDEMDLLLRNALSPEVLVGARFCRKEEIGDRVGQHNSRAPPAVLAIGHP